MKKIILMLMLSFGFITASIAQTTETKVKKTSSIPQKVHNTFSKHKRYNGYKTKKEVNGVKIKHRHTKKKDTYKKDD
jgi:hypothetical protein